MKSIETKIQGILNDLGFCKMILNDSEMYTNGKTYLKITFINKLKSYVVEYAETKEEAERNVFEDGDLFSIEIAEDELLKVMKKEILSSI